MMLKFYSNNYLPQYLNFIYIIIVIDLRVSNCVTNGIDNVKKTGGEDQGTKSTMRGAFPFWNPADFSNLFDLFEQPNERPHEDSPTQIDDNIQKMEWLNEFVETPDDNLLPVNSSIRKDDSDDELGEEEEGEGEEEEDTVKGEDTVKEEDTVKKEDKDEDESGENRSDLRKILPKLKKKFHFKTTPSHVILVPGLGGSRLQARWNKPNVPRYICDRSSEWVDIWVNLRLLLPYVIDCFLDNMRLEYNYTTNTTHEPAGVEVRVKSPSRVSHLENLVNLGPIVKGYYSGIVGRLVSKRSGFNYRRDVSILGAPYDFRKAPNELKNFFQNLKTTSETSCQSNNLKPVTFICHSLGCLMMLYFLQRQPQEWKNKYVKRLIAIGAPWGGSMMAFKSATVGYSLGPLPVSESKLASVERSLPSTMFLFPHKQVFKNSPLIISHVKNVINTTSTEHLLDPDEDEMKLLRAGNKLGSNNNNSSSRTLHDNSTNTSNQKQIYTLNNMKEYFDRINHPIGYKMWLETKDLLGSLEPPRVEVWCFTGRGFKTLARLDYLGDFPNSRRVEVYDDGDGTVNLESAKYCENWANQQAQPVHYEELKSSHIGLLSNERLINNILEIIRSN